MARAFNRRTIEVTNSYYPDEYPEPESIVQFGLQGVLDLRHRDVVGHEGQGLVEEPFARIAVP